MTDNPIVDAQDYFSDEKPMQYDHVCEVCKKGFYKGSQFDLEKFCEECVQTLSHIDFYKSAGLDDKFIYENILSVERKL